MADTTTPSGDKALTAGNEVPIPRITMGDIGFSAVKVRNGHIYEEANRAFAYPAMLKVVSEMKYSPPVSIALSAINILMNRADVYVEPVVGETATEKKRREFLYSVLNDMDSSFQTTMQGISTYKEYGHAVVEIVLRRRLLKNGSNYNDGLIGLAGLKNRPQNSIARWNFSEDGRKLESVSQSIVNLENSARYAKLTDEYGYIVIPREKFLLFRADATTDNPEGNSILKPAYLAYKQLSLISDHMMIGVSKDVAGIPFAELPPQYMAIDASSEDKAVYAGVKKIVDNMANGTQTAVVMPKIIDPETKQNIFGFQMIEPKTGKAFDLPAIIKMLQSNILSVLSCESITMGSDKGGSLSLQDSSTNMLALQVAYRLSEISNTMNQELVPLLWKMNGWSTERLPKIRFKDISQVSLEEFSKYLQRVMSVGGLEMDRGVMNKIREIGGFEPLPDDMPIQEDKLSTTLAQKSSAAGEGMKVGVTGDGTSKSPTKTDSSVNNSDNKA